MLNVKLTVTKIITHYTLHITHYTLHIKHYDNSFNTQGWR